MSLTSSRAARFPLSTPPFIKPKYFAPARMLAGKLQAAAKRWFPRLVQHRGVLPDFGAAVAAEGVGIVAPEH